MLRLPSAESPIRALFDVADLVALAAPEARMKLPSHREAAASAKALFAAELPASAAHFLVWRANGELHLERFGRLGGWKKVWNFGEL